MNMIRWQPFTGLMPLRRSINRIFEDSFIYNPRFIGTFAPHRIAPVDMYHNDDEVVIKATLPGVKPEEAEITITGNTLNIKGETKSDNEIKREDYINREQHHGTLNRTVTLPHGLSTDKAEATFDNGILTLTIPKSEEVKPKSIKIKAKDLIEGQK